MFRTIFPDRRNLRRICGAADVQDLRFSLKRLVDFRQRRKRECNIYSIWPGSIGFTSKAMEHTSCVNTQGLAAR